MRTSIFFGILLCSLFVVNIAFAQRQRTETVSVKTSAECEFCKRKIETQLSSEKGIKRSVVDLNTREVLVTFDPRKTSLHKIRSVISNAGYDADSIRANNKAYLRIRENHK